MIESWKCLSGVVVALLAWNSPAAAQFKSPVAIIDASIDTRAFIPQMQAAGMILHEDMTRISALGFVDVIRQYPAYKKIFEATK